MLTPRQQHMTARLAAHAKRCAVCGAEPGVVPTADGFGWACSIHPDAPIEDKGNT